MFVGYLRAGAQPGEMAKLLALACKSLGIELLYFTPNDVSIHEEKINGKVYLQDQWLPVEVDIPPFIDVTAYNYSLGKMNIFEFLNSKSVLSDNRLNLGELASNNPFIISKESINKELEKYITIKEYLIPTKQIKEFHEIDTAIDSYEKVVLKPVNGLKGKGVYLVSKLDKSRYLIEYKTEHKEIFIEDFKIMFDKEFRNGRYIVQKYVHSRTLQGDPFDCRIHLEKNGLNKWTIVKKAIRIGIGQRVISNVNQGGGIADCKQFLKANFGGKSDEINLKLNHIGNLVAPIVEKIRQTELMTLGLDIGISPKGDLYLFEINGVPATTFAPVKIAFTRVKYYEYMLKKHR